MSDPNPKNDHTHMGSGDDGKGYPAEHDPKDHREVIEELAKRADIPVEQASQLVARHGGEDVDQLLNYAKVLVQK